MITDDINKTYEALQLLEEKFPIILQENKELSIKLAESLNVIGVQEYEITECKGYIETLSLEIEVLKSELLAAKHFTH